MKSIFTLCLSLVLCFAVQAQKVKAVAGENFGAGISAKKYISFEDLTHQMSASDTVNATVRATVNEVCQMKGCWMTLEDSDMMVRFKDYGFFVPKDLSGREVLIEGEAFATVVTVDELRHYAEDAGKSAEEIAKISEPKRTYAFTATGVRVVTN